MMYISFAALYGWHKASMHAPSPKQKAAAYGKVIWVLSLSTQRKESRIDMDRHYPFQVPRPCLVSEDWKNWCFNRRKMTQVLGIPGWFPLSEPLSVQLTLYYHTPGTLHFLGFLHVSQSALAKALSQSLVEWNPSVAKAKKVMWWR